MQTVVKTTKLEMALEAAPQVGLLGYVRGAIPAVSGDIHVAFAYAFDTNLIAWTIIHEASHKFCGTNDNAYFSEPKYQQLTPKQRINNADNYGELLMP